MKKYNVVALLLALLLLLCGCRAKQDPAGMIKTEVLFEKTAAALEEGHLFFAGRVVSVLAERKSISFYEAESKKNTYYKVEVTEDFFGCLPQRVLTLCVMGNSDNFTTRKLLEKDTEYLFDATVWVQGEEVILLLPTFYTGMPHRQGDAVLYTDTAGTKTAECDYNGYCATLRRMAEEQGYGPEKVLQHAKKRFEDATLRNADYFRELDFANIDEALLDATVQTARARLAQADKTTATWAGIGELLQ